MHEPLARATRFEPGTSPLFSSQEPKFAEHVAMQRLSPPLPLPKPKGKERKAEDLAVAEQQDDGQAASYHCVHLCAGTAIQSVRPPASSQPPLVACCHPYHLHPMRPPHTLSAPTPHPLHRPHPLHPLYPLHPLHSLHPLRLLRPLLHYLPAVHDGGKIRLLGCHRR